MGEGHNHVRSIFERWRRLEEDKAAISDDLKELFQEAKSAGFDTKALRLAFREAVKAENETDRDRELAALVDLYLSALGGTSDALARVIPAREDQSDQSPADTPSGPRGVGSQNAVDDVPAAGGDTASLHSPGQSTETVGEDEQARNEPVSPEPRPATPIHHGLTAEQVAERDALADQWEAKMLRRAQ